MKAFLSHSSKDQSLVREIADKLGPARCEYDEYTFEYTLNAKAIRQAFARADLFVLFVSENSTKSAFVDEEIRTALDFRAQGTIKKVVIFPLDSTSYRALPDWLRATNVVIRLQSALTIFRKIEAELFALEAENSESVPILIARDEEELALRTALSLPPGQAPVALHIVGHIGIGRRTLLRETLKRIFPRQIQTFIPVVLGKFEGSNEFYRRLYELFVVSPIDKQIDDFEKFAAASEAEQVEILSDLFAEIASGEEFILVDDQGGIYTDEGQYHSFLQKLIETLKGAGRPFLGFAQTRMMPLEYREDNKASFHLFLKPMTDTQISQLTSFSLRDAGVDYSASQLADVCSILDGNPINVKLAIKAIRSYGLSPFLADPSLLIEWKRRRAEDFLSKIQFTDAETQLMAILFDYRFVTFEILRDLVGGEVEQLTSALRKVEEFCCVERRGVLYVISAPVHDAIGRDKRFQKSDGWKRDVALKILDLVSLYHEDDRAPVALFEAAALASLITGRGRTLIARYILPSYYLTLAQRAYNEDHRKQAIDFCKLAWERSNNLSVEGRIEVLRIWGLSAARLRNEEGLHFALKELGGFGSKKVARRHKHFLEGFSHRLRRRFDEAEGHFLDAHKLAPNNLSINRELANLYRHRREFIEGESYARAAHAIAPTNPFILDIFLECLLGKAQSELPVDQGEIQSLLEDLAKYGDVPGSSFYQTRIAQDLLRQKIPRAALTAASKAVERTADFLPCRYLRAEVYLALSNPVDARKDLDAINKILERRGGFSEDDEGKAVELEVRILTEERNFKTAREKLNNSQFLPHRVAKKLALKLAKAIGWEPEKADQKSKDWAHKLLN